MFAFHNIVHLHKFNKIYDKCFYNIAAAVFAKVKKNTFQKKINNCIEQQNYNRKINFSLSQSHQQQQLMFFRTATPFQTTDKLNSNNKIDSGKMSSSNGVPTKEEIRERLTPLQYQVTQESATERPFTGKYDKFYENGMYQCIVCHQDLFTSTTKYDSGCGWPAFNDVLDKGRITLHKDASIAGSNLLLLIMHPERIRTEVRCAKCGAHMGHVFEDGPAPTRKRYCINSASIEFISGE